MRFADNSFFTCAGSPVRDVYGPKVKPDGSVEIVKIGEENSDAYINSFKESTDISFILAKLSQGDDSGLRARVGSYGDFTRFPSTFAEVLQMQIDAGKAFDRLPLDVKREFNNDVNQFMASAGSEVWFGKMESVLPDSMKDLLHSDRVVAPSEPRPVSDTD